MRNIWYDTAKMHRGAISEIAKEHGCHRNWVRLVLKGDFKDDELMLTAAKILVAKESRMVNRRRDLDALRNQLTKLYDSSRAATAV